MSDKGSVRDRDEWGELLASDVDHLRAENEQLHQVVLRLIVELKDAGGGPSMTSRGSDSPQSHAS